VSSPPAFLPLYCTACARPVEAGHRHVGADGTARLLCRAVRAIAYDGRGQPLPDLIEGWERPVSRRFDHRDNDPLGMNDPVDAARAWAGARFTGDARVAAVMVVEVRRPLAVADGWAFGAVVERIERGDTPGPTYRVQEHPSGPGLLVTGGDGTVGREPYADYPSAREAAERLARGES